MEMPKLDRLACPPFVPLSQGRAPAPHQGVTAHTSHCGSTGHTPNPSQTLLPYEANDTLDLPLAPWPPERNDARTGGVLCLILLGRLAQEPQTGARASEHQPRASGATCRSANLRALFVGPWPAHSGGRREVISNPPREVRKPGWPVPPARLRPASPPRAASRWQELRGALT